MSRNAGYLLDTNVVSETRRPRPDPRITGFLDLADSSGLFVSALTIGELRRGSEIKRRSDADAATQIGHWIDRLEVDFADRILPVDAHVARRWGELSADRSRPVIDTLIAATALVHGLTLVTRNTNDMRGIGLSMVDPWQKTGSDRTQVEPSGSDSQP